jgi:hypothetical protein
MRGVPGDTRHGGREGGLQWKVPCLKIHTTARNGSDALHCPPPFMGPSRLLLIFGTFHSLAYNESEEARPTAQLSDQDASTLAGFRTLLASLHEGHEFSLIHNQGIWQKIHCSIAHRVHNAS